MGKYFNWPPFVAIPVDADTGKPVDPNVGMRVKREFYNVGTDGKGKKVMIAHKSPSGSKVGAEEIKEEEKKDDGKKGGNGNDGGKDNGKKDGEEKKQDKGADGEGQKKAADDPWTEEDDALLLRLKDGGKTWNQIIEVMGRNKGVLTKRFKELKDKEKGGEGGGEAKAEDKTDNDGKGGNGKEDKKDETANDNGPKLNKKEKREAAKAAKAEAKAEEAAAAAQQPPTAAAAKTPSVKAAKAPSVKAPSKAGSRQAAFTMQEWQTLQEDDLFSFGELQCLSELMMRDERHRWVRIASAFYDKTGRRVHPEDIREKFAEMGAMGGSTKG